MRIVTATLDAIYEWGEGKQEKEAAKVEKRKKTLARLGISVAPDADLSHPTVTVTETQLTDLLMAGEGVSIKSTADFNADSIMTAAASISAVADKLEKFANTIPEGGAHYNERVEVYTPGAGLMLFNRVLLLQDACSDALQAELDNGWRIIAACPQPDQRRPDYIMGRYSPEYADNSGAANTALRG